MKKVIIVGASSGIGKGLAQVFAENGYQVGITGRRTELLDQLKATKPDSFHVKSFDVRDTANIAEHLTSLASELGGLDLLCINSGTGHINDKLDFNLEKPAIDTNVSGFTSVADWAFNYFSQQGFGHLVTISSVAGLCGNRFAPAYSASKAYQINYLTALSQKAKKLAKPIYITDIRPGFVDTAMAQGSHTFWVAPVEVAARQIYAAIRNKKRVAYVTKRWRLIAIVLKLLPRFIYERWV